MTMLEPKYLEDLPDGVIDLYSRVEQDILSDMARRLMAYDYWLDSSLWQEQKLKEVGVLHDDIVAAMAGITGKSQTEIRRVMREACTRALKADGRTYSAAGLVIPDFNSSKALKNTLNAGLKATLGTFQNLTHTTANTASRQFEDALDRAWLKIKSGAFSTDTAVRDAIKELSAAGVGAITYPSGRIDTLETAVRRAIVTGVNKTAGEVQWQLADEMGCDLVQVTAHGGARPEHAAWQGGIYSRSGKSRKYKDFKETTGYGTGAGLCGWNCRHSFGPYIEGAPKAYSDKMLENYNAEKYEYNGQKMTEYEASQKQREIERNIRRWKRENKSMKAAGLDTTESAEKVKYWQARQRDFVRQTGLKRQYSREQIGSVGSLPQTIQNKLTRRISEARASDTFTIIPPMKGDAIKAQSIYKELQKSDVGKHAYEYIIKNNTPVEVNYTDEAPKGLRGRTNGIFVEIFARNTQTIRATTETIIHEVSHIELSTDKPTQWEEAYCFAQEEKHKKSQLTFADLKRIIKLVKRLYSELTWR